MSWTAHVRAPCRLHFGMFSFGHADRPQFGGVGVMIDPPAVEVACESATEFRITGDLAERGRRFAESATAAWQLPSLPACELTVRAPRDHIGLGVGTQLGLAIAAALRRFLQLTPRPVELLARDVGRAGRSAVGTHGFHLGGLIVDAGHISAGVIGSLAHRAELPEHWRVVLACPTGQRGFAGRTESEKFSQLSPVPEPVTARLWHLVKQALLPALARADCEAFGESVYEFGVRAGECFAAVQGGPFGSPEIAGLIGTIRQFGVRGAGQSSWGPTVFAVCRSDAEAQALADAIRTQHDAATCDLQIARPNNRGATIH